MMRATGSDEQAGLALIHGAELGSWIWESMLGHVKVPVCAVDLPGRNASAETRQQLRLEDAVTDVAQRIDQWGSGPVVLVLHSFAGVLAPGVTELLDARVKGFVWVGATVPVAGKSWLDLQPFGQRVVLRTLYRLRPAGVLSPAKQNMTALCNDVDPAVAADAMTRRVPEVPGFLTDPVRGSLPTDRTSHYVRLSQDRAQSERQRDGSIARLTEVVAHDLDAGHLPMLGQPEALAHILNSIAMAQNGSAAPV